MAETCKGKICPMFNKQCIEHACAFYQQLFGKNPQTGEPLVEFDCTLRWGNVLLIENAQLLRQVGAEVEALRAETSEKTIRALIQPLKQIGDRS